MITDRLTHEEQKEFELATRWLERYRKSWNKARHPPSKPFSDDWYRVVKRWRWLRDKKQNFV